MNRPSGETRMLHWPAIPPGAFARFAPDPEMHQGERRMTVLDYAEEPPAANDALAAGRSPGATTIDQLCIETIRTLSMDAVQKANSGHPGTPTALAPVAYTL